MFSCFNGITCAHIESNSIICVFAPASIESTKGFERVVPSMPRPLKIETATLEDAGLQHNSIVHIHLKKTYFKIVTISVSRRQDGTFVRSLTATYCNKCEIVG